MSTSFKIPLCNKIIQILVLWVSLFIDTQTCLKSIAGHASATSASTYKTSRHQNPGVYYHLCEFIKLIKKCSLIVISHAIVILVTVKEMEVIEWLKRPMRLIICKKGKTVPLQAWSGLEGSRKLRFPDFMTTAQDCGNVVSLTHRPPLPPGNTPGTHFC
jgi:hypothetical protein